MRRTGWLVVTVVGLGALLGAGALRPVLGPVGAQTPDPPVQIRRVQHADYLPAPAAGEPIFLLAIGSDARPGVCMPVERCLADSLHLIGVNPAQGAATILGFPRDSYVAIPGVGTNRVNEALHRGGPELVVRTVEALTGIRIDYYMLTSFAGLPAMVNGVGGIEVDVPYPMDDEASGAAFEAGPQRLDGRQALAFSRNRKDTPNGDFSRSENQGILLRAALEELHRDVRQDPAALFRWVVTGLRHVSTDLSLAEAFDLMLTALSVDPERVTNCVVPGTLGFAGSASIVVITDAAEDVYRDLARDGVARC
ncbi:MAG TPA: LCP family protein [Actinomycetota bacterium]|nr:LCP family protein [Actinomycetota bacterium]